MGKIDSNCWRAGGQQLALSVVDSAGRSRRKRNREGMPGMAKLKVSGVHVIIGEPDPIARRVIRDALQDEAGFVIPAEAATGREAVELSVHYRPDVVLMEASLPGLDGMTATRQLRDEAPTVRVVIFSQHDAEEIQLEALRAGACGFLSKDVPLETVARVLRSVVRGESAFSRKLTMRLIERLRDLPEAGIGMRPVHSPLTEREWEILDFFCQGKGTKQIAETLVLSEETVHTHSKNVLRKLKVHSRQEAVEAAQRLRVPV
jgi:DNA-binding NarL/FixJ family response regulator